MIEFTIFHNGAAETISINPDDVLTVADHPRAAESCFYRGLCMLTMRDGRQLYAFDPAGDAVERISAARQDASAKGKMVTITDLEQWELHTKVRAQEYRIAMLYDALQERDEYIARLHYMLNGDPDEGEEWKQSLEN